MNNIRKLLKVLTVLFSVSLVLVFIGFRGGYFAPLLAQQTPHDTTGKNLINRESKANTATYKKDSIRKHLELLSSSKSSLNGTISDSAARWFVKNFLREKKKRSDSLSKIKRKMKRE